MVIIIVIAAGDANATTPVQITLCFVLFCTNN